MGKCRFWKKCEWYATDSHTCNKTGGMYYDLGGDERPPGCYRTMMERENAAKQGNQR